MSQYPMRLLSWSPRILSIAFTVFLGLFALEAFNEGFSFWQSARAFFIDLLPAAAAAATLIAAWRREWIGALVFAVAAVLYTIRFFPWHPDWTLIIAGPMLVIAALFMASWLKHPQLRARH